jgi:Domain of unknown function (DUF1839)
MVGLLGLDPAAYTPSALHHPDRTFPETNCYVDLWIELLHALGIDPASAMAFACTVDFEGDQWTFFKPPPEELIRLYGIDVHEMQLYRPTVDHVIEQLKAGRTMIIEADSFYMPDRAATSYRRAHVKSSIAIEAIDAAGERLRYFHGPGYYELSGEDYRGVFRLGRAFSDDVLPPYTEVVRFDAGPRLKGGDLRRAAYEMLGRQLRLRPQRNPWLAFGERLSKDLPDLLAGTDTNYHAYAFATVRQCGAAFEVARSFVGWLADLSSAHAGAAADALGRQVNGAKALLFRLARRRAFDPAPAIKQLAEDWETAMDALDHLSVVARRGAA